MSDEGKKVDNRRDDALRRALNTPQKQQKGLVTGPGAPKPARVIDSETKKPANKKPGGPPAKKDRPEA